MTDKIDLGHVRDVDGEIVGYGDCPNCDGDGWITDSCFEDTCCCADPDEEHGTVPCPTCNPEGKK